MWSKKKCNLGGALDLPRPILEVKSAPKIELQSKSGSIIYITDMPRNFSPCPVVHLHFLALMGALVHINLVYSMDN